MNKWRIVRMKKLLYGIINILILPLYIQSDYHGIKTASMGPTNNYSFNAHKQIKVRYHIKNRLKSRKPHTAIKRSYYTNKSFKV